MASPVEVKGLEWLHGDVEPLVGTATVEVRGWEDLALDSGDQFASDLQAMGLPDLLIDQGLEVRDTANTEVSEAVAAFWQSRPYRYWETPPEVEREVTLLYDSARSRAWARLRDWWTGRITEVESRDPVDLRLPLFLLSAPAAAGCSTEFTSETSKEGKASWSLAVAGTGLGGEGKVAVTTSATFEAANGQRKVIFLPVTVILETIVLTEPGAAPVRRHRIDLAGLFEQEPAPGSLLLAPDALPPLGRYVRTYPLADDASGTIAEYRETYTQASVAKLEVGLKTQGVELGLTSEATMQSSVGLKFKLRSGLDYRLHGALEGDGLLWE